MAGTLRLLGALHQRAGGDVPGSEPGSLAHRYIFDNLNSRMLRGFRLEQQQLNFFTAGAGAVFDTLRYSQEFAGAYLNGFVPANS